MFKFFRRRVPKVEWRVKSRSELGHSSRPALVDIVRFAPDAPQFVGRIAYLHLSMFQYLSASLGQVPTPELRARVGEVATMFYDEYATLSTTFDSFSSFEFSDQEIEQAQIDSMLRRIAPSTWQEALMTALLVTGLLDDLAVLLADSLTGHLRITVVDVVTNRDEVPIILALLNAEKDKDPDLSGRLAMWGRRIVGDALLVARESLNLEPETRKAMFLPAAERSDEESEAIAHIEAAFADMITEHTRRMDALGMTA